MANKNQNVVEVVREVKVTVAGITIARDGRNIVLSQGDVTLNIPNGAVATAVLTEAQAFVSNEAPAKGKKAPAKDGNAPKRTRRTKAEMEAARAAEAAGNATPASTPESEEELETV